MQWNIEILIQCNENSGLQLKKTVIECSETQWIEDKQEQMNNHLSFWLNSGVNKLISHY